MCEISIWRTKLCIGIADRIVAGYTYLCWPPAICAATNPREMSILCPSVRRNGSFASLLLLTSKSIVNKQMAKCKVHHWKSIPWSIWDMTCPIKLTWKRRELHHSNFQKKAKWKKIKVRRCVNCDKLANDFNSSISIQNFAKANASGLTLPKGLALWHQKMEGKTFLFIKYVILTFFLL